VKIKILKVFAMSVLFMLAGCADDRVSQNQEPAQKTSTSATSNKNDTEAFQAPVESTELKEKVMKKRDPNALDAVDAVDSSRPKVSTVNPKSSKSLQDLLKEQGEIQKQDCEEQYKNENGVCEIPNQQYPLPEKK